MTPIDYFLDENEMLLISYQDIKEMRQQYLLYQSLETIAWFHNEGWIDLETYRELYQCLKDFREYEPPYQYAKENYRNF